MGTTDGPRVSTPTAATTVIAHATIVTVDDGDTVIDDGALAMRNGAIIAVGPSAPVLAEHAGAAVVDARGAIAMPGLINTHAHLAMTMFRGVADDRDLQSFLDRVFPLEAAMLSAATVEVGVRMALAESISAGCTATLDMYFWPEAAAAVADEAGFRLLAGPVFFGFPGPEQRPFPQRLAWADEVLESWPGPRWVMPHSTYTLTPDELIAVGALGRRHGARMHIHACENAAEVVTVRERYRRTPIGVLDDAGLLDGNTVLAHAVVLDDDEVVRLAATGTAVAHCPLSNLKTASGVARLPELLAAGVTVGLGTDGTATGNDLDLFLAMRLAATVHKGTALDAEVVPARAALRMATIDAARAIGIDHLVGSLSVGKRADVVLLDPDALALTPSYDPVSAIVYAAGRGDVRDVWIDGRRVLDARQLTTIDAHATIAAMRTLADTVRAAS